MSRQHAAAAVIFVLLSIAMTWPLAPNLGRAVSDFGDPYLNIWILDWDWWATLHQPLSLFHANAVHPAKYSLAFSENLYAIALLLFPLRAIGVGPIAAHNIAMLLGFAFCGFAAYLLGSRLTGNFAAGLAAGVFYAFVPFRFVHLTHVQHVWGGWLPLLLLTLLWYADAPSRKRAALFGAVFVMNGLTNIHYLFFGAFAAGVTALLLVPRRAWRDLALALVASMLILAPFLYPYAAAAKLYGMERTFEESFHYSATPMDWFTREVKEPERRLFPGILALLACVGAFVTWRQWQKLALAWLWIAIGFAGSLGMHFEFHAFLFGGVPGFRAIRVPARWAVIAYVGMAILIALMTAAIARRNRWVAFLVPLAFLVELWTPPIRWYLTVPQAPPVYEWLARGRTPIAEVPMDTFLSDYLYHLRATAHHRPMVNGVQQTQQRRDIAAKWFGNPIGDDFVDALKDAGVDLVVVHADKLYERGPVVREWLRRELDRGRMSYVRDFSGVGEGDWVFALEGGGVRPARLESFLRGDVPCTPRMFIAPLAPAWGDRVKGPLAVAGFAASPHGLRHADVYFNNRTIHERIPLQRVVRCGITEHRFYHVFSKPDGVWTETDVQVDVFDGAGNTITSESRWFRWE